METYNKEYRSIYDYIKTMETITFTTKAYLCSGTQGSIYRVTIDKYTESLILKIIPTSIVSSREAIIHAKITEDMLSTKIPSDLFPWLFKSWIQDDETMLLMSYCNGYNLQDYPIREKYSYSSLPCHEHHFHQYLEWFWAKVLIRVSKAIEYLESQEVNHNDILFKNIMINQSNNDLIVTVIDFGSTSDKNFIIGKDLNHFLFILLEILKPGTSDSLFPNSLASILIPLLTQNQYAMVKIEGESNFEWGLRLHSGISSPSTSGANVGATVGKWLSGRNIDHLSNNNDKITEIGHDVIAKCEKSRIRAEQCLTGMLIGDVMGMPVHLDSRNFIIIKFMEEPGRFNGMYKNTGWPAGTLTENMHISLLLYHHLLDNGCQFVPSVIKTVINEYNQFKGENLIDSDVIAFVKQGKKFPISPYCLIRYLNLIVFHQDKPLQVLIQETLKIAKFFEESFEAIWYACLVNTIVWEMLKTGQLVESVDLALKSINTINNGTIRAEQQAFLRTFSHINFTGLDKSMTVSNSLRNALWCVFNGTTYDESVIKAINIKGYTATVGALVGFLAVLLGRPIPSDMSITFQLKNHNNVIQRGKSQIKHIGIT